DFVTIGFQDDLRPRQAVGIYWPQALSVAAFSNSEARGIWAYRIPSLIGAMLAAVACGWGAAGFWGSRTGCLAGAGLGATLLSATTGSLATADALTAGATALAMASLARIYSAQPEGPPTRSRLRLLFWAALAGALLCAGWVPGAIALISLLLLLVADRAAPFARRLSWVWGLLLIALVIGPWLVAVTIDTDGSFWAKPGEGGNLSLGPRLAAALFATFPLIALLPAAAVYAVRHRTEPGVRFALAWTAASLLLFVARPAANLGDALYIYPPLAWLCAAAWGREAGPVARRLGAVLAAVGAGVLVIAVLYLLKTFGDADDAISGALTVILLGVAGAACAFAVMRRQLPPLLAAAVLTMVGQGVLVGVLLPRLDLLWPSQRVVAALQKLGLDPTDGLVQGPVTVAGYDEPSLVFALGAETEFADARAAARAINEGRPAIVEASAHAEFAELLARFGLRAQAVATVRGLDYSENRTVTLTIWRKTP
ncbi:MAG: 4-amino-4-deoxy-L-arabinose transferase, partial [Caulobacteraceae bacterium]|nr:4-amino-4-deoxy-L-arabinose transferase [Caulobacteraceae bacterium]